MGRQGMGLNLGIGADPATGLAAPATGVEVPDGVVVRRLDRHPDHRGDLVEVFRLSWGVGAPPVQWNLVRNRPGTLRGVHLHWKHEDYLIPAAGPFWIGLKDVREDSPTFGLTCELDLHAEDAVALSVPVGVAHGFHFPEESAFLYGVSTYWDVEDELACAWNDPGLGFTWARLRGEPRLSRRDAEAGSLADMIRDWRQRRAALA
jgi:dTDP-4-dehydrorhamnose 3,5-epimerase